jgi:hypothetical protein
MARYTINKCDRCHVLYHHNSYTDTIEFSYRYESGLQYNGRKELCYTCGNYISRILTDALHSSAYYTTESMLSITTEIEDRNKIPRITLSDSKIGGK